MVPNPSRQQLLLGSGIAIVLIGLFLFPGSPLSLTGDESETPRLTVSSLDRIEAGCADDVATFASSHSGNGEYTRTSFIETGNTTANLTARTERTSPVGADLSTFRVYVDSTGQAQQNASCRMGIQYRLELDYDPVSSRGFLSGDDGTRVLWLENDRYGGCSSTTSGSLDAECGRFLGEEDKTVIWANLTED